MCHLVKPVHSTYVREKAMKSHLIQISEESLKLLQSRLLLNLSCVRSSGAKQDTGQCQHSAQGCGSEAWEAVWACREDRAVLQSCRVEHRMINK